MNFKGFFVYATVFAGALTACGWFFLLPCFLVMFFLSYELCKGMSYKEVSESMGAAWLEKKLGSHPLFKNLTEE